MVSPGQLFVHTSGRHGAGVFKPLTEQGAIGLAVHPAMTFTGLSLKWGVGASLHQVGVKVSR